MNGISTIQMRQIFSLEVVGRGGGSLDGPKLSIMQKMNDQYEGNSLIFEIDIYKVKSKVCGSLMTNELYHQKNNSI